ncbi:MAG: hypothetical protein WC421_04805 [Elusimicrobiales bacterium]
MRILAILTALCAAALAAEQGFEQLLAGADKSGNYKIKADYYKRALESWKDGRDSKSRKAVAHERLAVCYLALGRAGEAQNQMNFALALDSASAGAHITMSQVLLMQGNCAGALKETDAALALAPSSQRAALYFRRGAVNSNCARNDPAALDDLASAVAVARQTGQNGAARKSLIRSGAIKCRRGDFAQGEADLAGARRIPQSGPREDMLELGKCRQRQRKNDKALEDYSAFIASAGKAHPRLAEARCRRGEIRLEAGDTARALDDFSAGLRAAIKAEAAPKPPLEDADSAYDMALCHRLRARIYERRGDRLFARQDYEEACRLGSARDCKKAGKR